MPLYIPEQQMKVLILLSLKSAKAPLPLTALTDIPANCDLNPLTAQLCVNELLDLGHIVLLDEYVKLSDTGKLIVDELEMTAPLSLRKRIVAATTIKLAELRRALNVNTVVTEVNDGYKVSLVLLDGGEEIFNLSFLCPTSAQAENCARTFKEQPTDVFRKFLGVLVKEEI